MDREDVPKGKKRSKDGWLVSAAYGGRRDGAGRPPKTSAASIESISQQLALSTHPTPTTTRNAAAASSQLSSHQLQWPATFFLPHKTNQAVPGASNTAGGHTASQGNADLGQNDASRMRSESHSTAQGTVPGVLSQQALHRLPSELAFVGENDVHGDIASGLDEIDDSLVDELIPNRHSDDNNTETSEESEATEAFNCQYLQTVNFHTNFGPNTLYHRDVFVWLPDLLTGYRNKFKCHCGKRLSNHGYPDKPIARCVHCIPDYYFLFTNRFWCDSSRNSDPGCGQSFLGTDPHIIGQTPRFVQERFPAYISTRGAVDKDLIMWPQTSRIVKCLGPAPFSEMVSEL
ncbi:hypothetical protein CPB85DRAFT_1261330 [Mucidula mucida]|nr:hypothetical protein CPB85DRAFT_1261330 [Mucidula mucida]